MSVWGPSKSLPLTFVTAQITTVTEHLLCVLGASRELPVCASSRHSHSDSSHFTVTAPCHRAGWREELPSLAGLAQAAVTKLPGQRL